MSAVLVLVGLLALTSATGIVHSAPAPEVEIPQVGVKFGSSPFVDDTDGILALQKGWFKDVGIRIEPAPQGALYSSTEAAAVLLSGRVDVQAVGYRNMIPALNYSREIRMFAYSDFFIGSAIMGKKDYTSFAEFRAKGMSPADALKAAVAQLRGRTLTWSPNPAIRGFGRDILSLAGVNVSDVKTESLEDDQGVQLMLAGRADFMIGGGPARITLQKAGFKTVIAAADLTGIVRPPYNTLENSKILSLVGINGLATTASYYENNRDTIMRFASVKWRTTKYIAEHPDEAAPLHAEILNRVGGTSLGADDVKVIYRSIDPFIPFEQQGLLWFDRGKPTFELNMIQAVINSNIANKVLNVQPRPEDITVAYLVYFQAVRQKRQADDLMAGVTKVLANATQDKRAVATRLLENARRYYEWYDFLDATRFAAAARDALR